MARSTSTRQPDPEKSPDPAASLPAGKHRLPVPGTAAEPSPPSRAEFERLAAQVRRLAAQIAHGRA